MPRLLAVGLLLTLSTQAAADPLEDAVARALRPYSGARSPGAAVLVIQSGQVRARRAVGLADVRAGTRVTPQTRFRLASLSKAFTAMSIAILHDQSWLSLDDPVTKHVPELPAWANRITLRHIVHHRSGFPDYEGRIPSNFPNQISDLDVVKILARQTGPTFAAGSRYAYSNAGYAVLSVVVERVSHLPYPEFVRRAIFAPLGMGAVVYRAGHNTVEHRAYGHSRSGSGYRVTDQSRTSAVNGDGSVYASIDDLARWATSLSEPPMLTPAGRQLLFHPGPAGSYGFGWQLGAHRGQRRVSHTGSTIGFRSAIEHYPQSGLTVVVLVNRANASPWDAARRIADAALSTPPAPPATTPSGNSPGMIPHVDQPAPTPAPGSTPTTPAPIPTPAPKRLLRPVVDLPLGESLR